MKRFTWRLQRVLDIKGKEEQIKKAELLGITEKLAQRRGELFMKQRLLKDMIESLSEEEPKVRLDKQAFFLRFSSTNDELIKKLKCEIKELVIQQKEKIAEVLKIRQFKEGLEKLRVEAKSQFIKEHEKLEQKDANEMATESFARKIAR